MERRDNELLAKLKSKLPELEKLLEKVNSEWNYEDGLYRFYHHSFKVFRLQELTIEMVEAFRQLHPKGVYGKLNEDFMQIYSEGTHMTFTLADNDRWHHVTRPIVEAFLHSKYFLEMAVKSGKELAKETEAPTLLPSGWAAFLYLFDMR